MCNYQILFCEAYSAIALVVYDALVGAQLLKGAMRVFRLVVSLSRSLDVSKS